PQQRPTALTMAQQAAALQPRSAHFLDTVAYVQAASGDYTAAAQTLRAAIRLDPLNPQWQVALAWNLMRCGSSDEAHTLIQQVLVEHGPSGFPPPVQKQIQDVQAELEARTARAEV